MRRRVSVWAGLAVLAVCLVGISQPLLMQPYFTLVLPPASHYLQGNIDVARGSIASSKEQESVFFGSMGFSLWASGKSVDRIQLSTLNLVSPGIPTGDEDSGVLSIWLPSAAAVDYDPRSGRFSADVQAALHYELIDRRLGFQKQECRGECDLFEPYTEKLTGRMVGQFEGPLSVREEGRVRVEADLTLQISERVLGAVGELAIHLVVVVNWSMYRSASVLRIQPVFVGTGPSDPTASGTAFNTLMTYAQDMWNRCADARCIKFVVNDPIYVNNNAYKILDNATEAAAFRDEVNVTNAVEVFVASGMSTSLACSWGGGACFSSGTASAKIVSCDQQMAVPCPCPAACTSYCPCGSCLCGAINPYHLAHELGHALNLPHPSGPSSTSTVSSIMEPSGFCCDNPDAQSAKNCRNATNPLLYSLFTYCSGKPDISD